MDKENKKPKEDELDEELEEVQEKPKKDSDDEVEEPATFVSEEAEQPPSEHTLADLEKEEISEDEQSPHLDKQRFTRSEIPHLNTLGSRMPSSIYASNTRTSGTNKFHLLILIAIGLGVIGATVYLLRGTFSSNSTKPSPSAQSVVISSPAPSPSPESVVDRSKIKIRVLNGTSTSGLAASVVTKLEELGYKKDRVGNATNSAFTQTIVRVKPDLTDLLSQLIKDLSPGYEALSGPELKSSDAADAEVILGTK